MIKANELRVGNRLLFRRQSDDGDYEVIVKKVKGYSFYAEGDEVYPLDEEIGQIEPIALTPEWLERLGFENGRISYSYYTKILVEKYTTATQGWLNEAWRVVLLDSIPHSLGRQFKYVHELQNLYFALTGEDLTIKQPA